MSRMVRRPPATRFHVEPQQGPLTASVRAPTMVQHGGAGTGTPARDLGRQTFGAVETVKAYGGAQAGSPDERTAFQYVWQDRVQVPPAHEQPKLIFHSGAQPLIRWGLMRRFVRTFMAASPRFQGRWAYVGFIQRQYAERARISGVPGRSGIYKGTTYTQGRPSTGPGPRAIVLGEMRRG